MLSNGSIQSMVMPSGSVKEKTMKQAHYLAEVFHKNHGKG